MDISIRMASLDDRAALARLRWEDSNANKLEPEASKEAFMTEYQNFVGAAVEDPRLSIWVAEHKGEVVSHSFVQIVSMVPRPGQFGRSWGYASAVYTTPEYRNRGIGTSLLAEMIEWARNEVLESLLLQSGDRSVPLYERVGFARPSDTMELELQP